MVLVCSSMVWSGLVRTDRTDAMAKSKNNGTPPLIPCYCENGAADENERNHTSCSSGLRGQEVSRRPVFDENFQYNHSSCMLCNGYYGPNFGEPVCSTCHAFIYPEDLICAHPVLIFSEKTDDGDSGNDEPSELWFERRQSHNRVVPSQQDGNPPGGGAGGPHAQPPQGPQPPQPPSPGPSSASPSLAKRIEMLSIPHLEGESVSPGLVATLPPEVLLTLFSYMDDLSLWSCARVCKRWRHLLQSHIPDVKWERDTNRRWPLFRPLHVNNSAHTWFKTYSKLVSSSPCWMCLQQLSAKIQPPGEENMWRRNRLLNELKTLRTDPPEGIEAIPLDNRYCHWQATIMGPADSPYAGGLFYLYLQVPSSYPMCPPVVRFLTRIFHPNVSRHGDVGIDSINDNWSLVLTISKVLISIQSLLTDPFCEVCMEPDIGKLYQNDRQTFDDIARAWTWRFAMVDVMTDEADFS